MSKINKINKRASTEWTVGKLVTIILLVVLLVLVIWGVSSGALTPLKERVVGMFDNVMAYIKGTDISGNGEITKVMVNGKEADFSMTKDECKIHFLDGSGDYRLNFKEKNPEGNYGRFERWDGSAWQNPEVYSEDREWKRQLYHAFVKKVVTDKFRINFDGKDYTAVLDSWAGLSIDLGSAGKYAFGRNFLGESSYSNDNIVLWYLDKNGWVESASRKDLEGAGYEWKKKLYFAFLDYVNRKNSNDFSIDFEGKKKELFLEQDLISLQKIPDSESELITTFVVYAKFDNYWYGFDKEGNFYFKNKDAKWWNSIVDDYTLASDKRAENAKQNALIKDWLNNNCR